MIEPVRQETAAFNQSHSDAIWERTQEHALRAFRSGETAPARNGWKKAFDLAERHFSWGDPRVAASYTNQAFSLNRQQQAYEAKHLLDEAARCWEDSWRWVPLMVPLSTEEAQYDGDEQKAFYALIRQGQSITEALAEGQPPPKGGFEDWLTRRPAKMCDERKLLAAVYLMVSKRL
jgi:hypothetical protein